jgi:two-component system, chemotaxis family, response regulator PixG
MRRIVFVDDNPDFLDLVEQELQDQHFEIITILDKKDRDLVEIISAQRPDILFIDVYLASIDGKELCSLLRNNAATKHIPVYLISFSERADTKRIADEAKVAGSFSKPLEKDQILELLAKHFPSDQ